MHTNEFCYWLQGYFELTREATVRFDDKQVELVRKHLDLVREVEGKLTDFTAWLDGVLDSYELLLDPNRTTDTDEARDKTMGMIKTRLGSKFKHDIDPSYGPENVQEVLDGIHNTQPQKPDGWLPSRPPPGPTLYRC